MKSIQESFQMVAMNISIQIVTFWKAAFKIQVNLIPKKPKSWNFAWAK